MVNSNITWTCVNHPTHYFYPPQTHSATVFFIPQRKSEEYAYFAQLLAEGGFGVCAFDIDSFNLDQTWDLIQNEKMSETKPKFALGLH